MLRIISKTLLHHTYEYLETTKIKIYSPKGLFYILLLWSSSFIFGSENLVCNYSTQVQTMWGFSGAVVKARQLTDSAQQL